MNEIPTPETDAVRDRLIVGGYEPHECFREWQNSHRDLGRRLTIAREALMAIIDTSPSLQHAEQQEMMKTIATVTRYPTGYFGIDYQGCMFFDSSFDESEIHEKLEQLRIPANQVKWEERYFDTRFSPNDPRSYKTRKFTPTNA